MRKSLGCALVAAFALSSFACAGKDRSTDEAVDAGSDPASTSDASVESCKESLTPMCPYDAREMGCSSVVSAQIPLKSGQTWGDVDVQSGPYGGYVEWNEGAKFANPVSALESSCSIAAAIFGEPASVTQDVLDLRGQDLALYTVFRPACMAEGEEFPVITWGNGTCGQAGGYGVMLATLASHGFVIIAANSRWTDGGNNEMLRALDFAKAANEDPASSLYHHLDLDKVGAMGHSQGASATAHAATDPRIKSIILWNGGTAEPVAKPFLVVSAERDIGGPTPASLADFTNAGPQPGAWLFFHKVLVTGGNVTGHLLLMEQPERVIEPMVAWWKYQLNGDEEAKKMFVGDECGLCNKNEDYEVGQHNLP